MMARISSGVFFRAAAMRSTRFPYSPSTTLLITSRVSGLMSERVNMSPKSLYLPACSTSIPTPTLSSVCLKYIISARRPFSISGSVRAQVDAVRRQCQIVIAGAGIPQVGKHRLSRFPELLDIGADLLQLRPARLNALGLQHHRLDLRIRCGLLEVLPDAGNGGALLPPPINSGSSTGGFSGISPSSRITSTELLARTGGFSRNRSAAKKRRMRERNTSTTPVTRPMKNFAIATPTVAWPYPGVRIARRSIPSAWHFLYKWLRSRPNAFAVSVIR